MKIRHDDLITDENDPFLHCKLDRRKYANILTGIIGSYADGFVLAINNPWGTGKTTFVKMWRQQLINDGYHTAYFNAWENDFDHAPIVAIVAELKTLTEKSTERLFKGVLEKGASLTKAVLPAIAKAATKRYFDADEVTSAVENVAKAAADTFDDQVKDYKKKKDSINAFKKKLEAFVEKAGSGKPIIFIIDELDRCRPDYAVEVLEQMKHFFSVQGIVFVISIDKRHLSASINGFYGSENINTDEYLRRFIDLEYSIPEPSQENFCKYLYDYFSFDEFLKSPERSKHEVLRSDSHDFLRMATILLQSTNATLRQMEKIFSRTRLTLRFFKRNSFVMPDALFLMVYLSVMRPVDYQRLSSGRLKPQEICDLYSELGFEADGGIKRYVILLLARLLVLYKNEFFSNVQLSRKDPDGNWITDLNSELETEGHVLGEAIHWIHQDFDKAHVKLGHLTKKIELTETLEIETDLTH
jgi:hypothetical protein